MTGCFTRLTGVLLIVVAVFCYTESGDTYVAAAQTTGSQHNPEIVTSTPSRATLQRGEAIEISITADSGELPPYLTLEVDEGLQIVGEPACKVDFFGYPLGSGPEKSSWSSLDCTGSWTTDPASGITTMEAGVPDPGMNPVTHSIVVLVEVQVSNSAKPGASLNIWAYERLSRKAIVVIKVPNETTSSRTQPTVTAVPDQAGSAKSAKNLPFVNDVIEAEPGRLIRFDLEPEMDPLGGVVFLDLILPAGVELLGIPSCESIGPYTCEGKTEIQEHDDGRTSVHWRLSGQRNDSVNITVAVRVSPSEPSGNKLPIVALLNRPSPPESPVKELKSELIIYVVDVP